MDTHAQASGPGLQRRDLTGTDHTITVGGHSRHRVEGEMDITAGESIRLHTQVFEINAAQSITLKGPGGTIRIDAGGITVDGTNLHLKGPMKKEAAGAGNSFSVSSQVEDAGQCLEE